jgi:hypothetical protein
MQDAAGLNLCGNFTLLFNFKDYESPEHQRPLDVQVLRTNIGEASKNQAKMGHGSMTERPSETEERDF